jgi:acyl-CoA synthetase (AMP-forming)/AMP-acid ligase II
MPPAPRIGQRCRGDLTENGHIVVCGRVKDVIIMAGRSIYPTDVERAATRVEGVRPGCAVAVRLDAGHSRESFAVAVESNAFDDPADVRRIKHQVAHEVVAEVDMRPRNVVVLARGPSRKPRPASFAAAARAHCSANRAAAPTVFTSRRCDRRLPTQRGSPRGRELPSAPFQLVKIVAGFTVVGASRRHRGGSRTRWRIPGAIIAVFNWTR